MPRSFLTLTLALLSAGPAAAQFDLPGGRFGPRPTNFIEAVEGYEVKLTPASAKPGQTVTLEVTVTPKDGFWTYPANPTTGQEAKNKFTFPDIPGLVWVDQLVEPKGADTKNDPERPGKKKEIYPGPIGWTWTRKAVVSPSAKPGKLTALLEQFHIQVCDDAGCFNAEPSKLELTVEAGSVPVDKAYADAVAAAEKRAAAPPPAPPGPPPAAAKEAAAGVKTKTPIPPAEHAERLAAVRSKIEFDTDETGATAVKGGLWSLLATAAVWGWVSLVTPCVFPMIPITVSLFLKQANKSAAQTLKLAAVYSLTIVVVLGLSAFALLERFVALSIDPLMNIFLGGLFVFFALSLFGLYNIALPGFLLRYTESKRVAGGVVGTVFGALAFTVVSFTCVAPFLGGFAGLAATGGYSKTELALAGLAFASAFASPFFLLALFPSLIRRLPKSGGWLDTVKVVMGFLELAAALKFFRTAELRLLPEPAYFTYDLVLGGWVAIAATTGLYLLGQFRLPHDEEKGHVGVVRMLFAIAFAGFAVYIFPALFKGPTGQPQRPSGALYAWVDAFLLPDGSQGGSHLPWGSDLKTALDSARETAAKGGAGPRLVFIDFTGVTCTNCKYNEENVFTKPAVKDLLERFELVQMYTDDVPAMFYASPPADLDRTREARANARFRTELFKNEQLPLYVVLKPEVSGAVKVLGVYDEGKINDAERFADFLRKRLDSVR